MTLTEAMHMLARQMGAEGASEATIYAYQKDVRHFVNYLTSVKARDGIPYFTRENVQAWLIEQTEKGIAPKTRNRRVSALARIATFLEGIGKLDRDPTHLIKRAKEPKRIVRYLPAEVATRLIRAAGPTILTTFGHDQKQQKILLYTHRNEAILRVFVQGGLRLEEVVELSLRSLKQDGLIVSGKGNKERLVTMPEHAMQAIQRWLDERIGGEAPEDALFTNRLGQRLSRRMVAKVVTDAAAKLSLEGVHPHLLRHTMASLLREREVKLDVIRDRLGHDSIVTTEVYLRAVPLDQTEAANVLNDL